jgi:hypothetical protein
MAAGDCIRNLSKLTYVPDLIPIPGTKRRTWLEGSAAAAQIALAPDDVTELKGAVPRAR